MSRCAPAASVSGFACSAEDGLTLIEVLVSLMLLSLLAAAVFPVVTQRVGRGEPIRAAHELDAVRSAIERFAADLDGALPGDIEDLSNLPDPRDRWVRADGRRRPFDESRIRRWGGPYLDVGLADGGAIVTGFDLPIQDDLVAFDGRANTVLDTMGGMPGDSAYLAVRLGRSGRQLTAAQFEAINDLIDGQREIDGPGDETSWTLGRFRFEQAGAGDGGIGYYLAVPLR